MKIICRLLDVLSILFLADEDSVGTYSHYYVLESVYIDVVLEFVYDAGLITVLTYDDIDDDVNLELVSGGISDAALS